MVVPGRNHGIGLFQLFDSASHFALDTDNTAVKIKGKILLAAEEHRSESSPRYLTSTRLALLQRAGLQPINACLTEDDDDDRTPPAWALDRIVIRNWMREFETVPFLFFSDAENPSQTATSLFNHIAVDVDSEKLVQFFEFRDWDCRYDSVESMLCTFLLDIQLHGDWLEKTPVWTLDYLLHLYHRFLFPPIGTDPPSVIWVLANFDSRIESYQWLLSRLSLLAMGSKDKLGIKVLVVNQQVVELDPDIADITFFKTISLKEANDHRDTT
ncbi:hypothetical protein J3458_012958 [Metarhizium acridum]|uniref:uncharacterized protein n=1 Tax=Metarhizium acridum TaxID=92637 RepID=UPI001C6BB51F|nr:hypothetical protein J3458_012958 [Metarhizium acridum]